MPNRNSRAGHIPLRTCVICKQEKNKGEMFRFVILGRNIVYDLNRILKGRGYYVCDRNFCLEKIDKWKTKLLKKRGIIAA